jgi:hypothetical protein
MYSAYVGAFYSMAIMGSFQKRKRNPAVGSMLLRWRKP